MKRTCIFILLFLFCSSVTFSQSWEELNENVTKYYNEGKYEIAIEYGEKAVIQAEKEFGKNHPNYATSLNNLFLLYKAMGQYEKAEPLFLKALAIRKEILGENHPDYATSLNNLAALYEAMGQYEKSEPLILKASEIYKEVLGENHPYYATSLNNLAELYRAMGQYEKAEPLFLKASETYKEVLGEKHSSYATSLNNLAGLYGLMGQYEKSESLYLKTIEIDKEVLGESHPNYATDLNNLAGLYEAMGRYEKAKTLYLKASEIDKEVLGENHPSYATDLNNLAGLYSIMGQYEKAESLFLKASEIIKEVLSENHPYYAASLNNLAELYRSMGQYEKVEPLILKALAIRKEVLGENHPYYANSLNNLAELYRSMGQYEKAEPLILKALAIVKEVLGENHPSYATSLNNLALLYDAMGQYEKAEPLFLKASEIYKEVIGEEHPNYASTLNNIALLYRAMGQYEKAESLLLKVIEIDKEAFSEKHPSYANSLNNLAGLYSIIGQYEKAEPLFLKALAIRKEVLGENHPSYANSLNNLALLYDAMGQYEKAEPLFIATNKNYINQLNTYFTFLSELEKMEFLKTIDYNFEVFNSYVLNRCLKNPIITTDMLNLRLATKSVILSSINRIQETVKKSGDPELYELSEKLVGIKKKFYNAYLLSIEEREKRGILLDELEEQANELEKELSRKSEIFSKEIEERKINWNDIKNKLSQNEAVIEFIDFDYYDKRWTDTTFYCALVLRSDYEYPQLVKLCDQYELNEILSIPSENIGSYVRLTNRRNKLYQLVWQPIEHYLSGVSEIYISPSGILNKVSFAALGPGYNELLIDKYRIHYIMNTRSLALRNGEESKIKEGMTAAVFGGAMYDLDSAVMVQTAIKYISGEERWSPSPIIPDSLRIMYEDSTLYSEWKWEYREGTLILAEKVKELFESKGLEVTLYKGSEASEDAFKSLDFKSSPEILHISTHGYFFPKPKTEHRSGNFQKIGPDTVIVFKKSENPLMRSGLIMSGANRVWTGSSPIEGIEDGILTAYEVSNMDLMNTELVVLSACETGLGDVEGSEGVYGLQRSFKIAGTKTLIMSLWKVPDKQTVELMEKFYTGWLSGMSKKEAFRNAQEEMREEYNDPYYWAAFVMVE